MARKLNKNLVGALVLSMMVLTTVIGVILLKNLPDQDPAKYVADAKRFLAEGKAEQAMKSYARAYQKDPNKDSEYLVEAGRCAIEDGDIAHARGYIREARVKDPQLKSAMELELSLEFELAPIMDTQSQWHSVLNLAEAMLAVPGNSDLAMPYHAMAKACFRLQKEDASFIEKGEAALDRAHALDPGNVEIVTMITGRLWRLAAEKERDGETGEADALKASTFSTIDQAIKQATEVANEEAGEELARLRALFQVRDGTRLILTAGRKEEGEARVAEGIAALKSLIATATTRPDTHQLLGNLYSGVVTKAVPRDLGQAEAYLQQAMEIDPTDGRTYELLGRIYQAQLAESKDPAEVEAKADQLGELYRSGLSEIGRTKHFRQGRNNRARVFFIQELFRQELNRAAKAEDSEGKQVALGSAEAWIEQLKEELSAASFQVRLLSAQLLLARDEVVAATREAEAAKRISGGAENLELQRLLAGLYAEQRQWGAAQSALEKALSLSPQDPSLYIDMARVLLQLRRPNEARSYLEPTNPPEVHDALAKNDAAIRLRVLALQQLNQPELAANESRRLSKIGPEDEIRLVQLMIAENRNEEAEKRIKDILAADPGNPQAVQVLVFLLQKTNRMDEARQFINTLLSENPADRFFQKMALMMLEETDEEARQALIIKFIEEEEDEFTRYVSLATYLDSIGRREEAIESLDKAEAIKPDSSTVVEMQLNGALREKDWDRARQYATKHGELNIDGTGGSIAQGRLAASQAREAAEEGRADDASALYEQAVGLMEAGLQKYGSYAGGWTYLGQTYLSMNRLGEAKSALGKAIEMNPTDGGAHKLLAAIAIGEGDEQSEREHLNAARASLPNDEWIANRARIYTEKDNPAEGIAQRERARAKNPDDSENLVQLARLYANPRVADYQKAAAAFRHALELSKDDLALASEVARFFGSPEVGLPAEGEKLLKDLLVQEEDKAKKAQVALAMGRFYELQDVLATADRHYRMAASFDSSAAVLSAAAEFYARTNRYKDALEYYDRVIELASDKPEIAHGAESRRIAVRLAMGSLDGLLSVIEAFVERYPDDSQGLIYLGAYHRIAGDIKQAEVAFNSRLENDPRNAVALWQRGELHLLRGHWELAIDDLRAAKNENRDGFNHQHRISLAQALVQAGRGEDAIGELRLILDEHPENERIAEALIDMYTNPLIRPARYAEAEILIHKCMQRYPRDFKWPSLLGKLGNLRRDFGMAVDGFTKAAEVGEYRPDAIRPLFVALRSANRPESIITYATEKLSSKLLDRIPEALSTLAWAYAKVGKMDEAYATFARAIASSNAEFATYTQVIADMVVAVGKEAALERVREEAKADPDNVEKQQALVHLLKINDQIEEAIATCDRIMTLSARDAELIFAHLAKGMLLSSLDRHREAVAEYEAVLKLNPDQSMGLNNLAYVLGDCLNQPAEALPYAQRASRLNPRDDNYLDTYGWILARNDRLGEAAGSLLRALEIAPENLDALYHLGVVYLRQGEFRDARERLEKAKSLAETQAKPDYLPKITKALQDLEEAGQ